MAPSPRRIEAGGLRRADAERVRGLQRREPQSRAAAAAAPDGADRAGDVIAAGRMGHAGADADAKADFVAGGERREQFGARGAVASATARLAGSVTAPG